MADAGDRAQRVIDFIETLRLPDGDKAGQPFILEEFQRDVVRQAYTRDGLDHRIIFTAIASWPRKNGKTAFIAAIVLVHLVGPEAVRFGQLYSCGVDREQAAVLFNYARNMVRMDAELSERINITETRKQLRDRISGSLYTALSADVKNKHGKSASLVVFDELAQFGTKSELYSVMTTSQGAHPDAMTWIISTQSPDDASLLSQKIDFALSVQRGEAADPTTILSLYAAPPEADIFSEATWYAANPGLGKTRGLAELRRKADECRNLPSLENEFRNLYLNQRVAAEAPAIDIDLWRGAQVDFDPFDSPELDGLPCYLGVDIGSTTDLFSLAAVWKHARGLICATWSWTPSHELKRRSARDGVPYHVWCDDPRVFLSTVAGRILAEEIPAEMMQGILARWNVEGAAFDMAGARRFFAASARVGLDCYIEGEEDEGEHGLKIVRHAQGWAKPVSEHILNMDDSIRKLEREFASGSMAVRETPLLTWCMSNGFLKKNPTSDDRKWLKRRENGRIDEIVALTMAVGLARREGLEDEDMDGFFAAPVIV